MEADRLRLGDRFSVGNEGKKRGHATTQVPGCGNREVLFRDTNTLRGHGFGGGGGGEALHLRHIKYEVWGRHSNTAVQEASLRALMDVPLLRVGHRKRNLQRDPSRVARKVRVK